MFSLNIRPAGLHEVISVRPSFDDDFSRVPTFSDGMLDQDIIADGKRLQCVSSAVSSVIEVFCSSFLSSPALFQGFGDLALWRTFLAP